MGAALRASPSDRPHNRGRWERVVGFTCPARAPLRPRLASGGSTRKACGRRRANRGSNRSGRLGSVRPAPPRLCGVGRSPLAERGTGSRGSSRWRYAAPAFLRRSGSGVRDPSPPSSPKAGARRCSCPCPSWPRQACPCPRGDTVDNRFCPTP